MIRKALSPGGIHPPLAHYSHAVVVNGRLFSSGVLGIAPNGEIPDSIEAQCELCFQNLQAILREAEMDFADVVRFNAFVTDRAYFEPYGRVRARYAPDGAFASTLIIVSGFTRPEFKVEVEITALRGKAPRAAGGRRAIKAAPVRSRRSS